MSSVCVSDLMHCCASATICSESTLREAAEHVLTTGLETIPVVDHAGRFQGLVAQAALIRELLSAQASDKTVAPIVSRHVESARLTAALDAILPLFRSASVNMVPVVDENDRPVGLIHRRDIIQYLLHGTTSSEESTVSADGLSADGPASVGESPDAENSPGPHFLKDRRKKPTDR